MKAIIRNDAAGREKVIDYLRTRPDGEYQIEIKTVRDSRSLQQNAYYWGIVLKTLKEQLGADEDDIHEACRLMFLTEVVKLANGKELKYVKSTTSLDTKEFEIYLSEIRQFASVEWGVYISLPNEVE